MRRTESRARANDTLAGVDSLMTAIGDVEGSFGSGGDSVDFDRLKEALDKTDHGYGGHEEKYRRLCGRTCQ